MPAWGLIVPAAFAIGKGIYGAATQQKKKGRNAAILKSSYESGLKRQQLRQGDERQSSAESLVARGLAGGGDVNTDVYADKDVPQARTLGMQRRLDLRGEQKLERDDLWTGYKNALQSNKDGANAASIQELASGLGNAASIYSSGKALQAANSTPGADMTTSLPAPAMPSKALPDLSAVAWGGINPVDPFASGKYARRTSSFNVVKET